MQPWVSIPIRRAFPLPELDSFRFLAICSSMMCFYKFLILPLTQLIVATSYILARSRRLCLLSHFKNIYYVLFSVNKMLNPLSKIFGQRVNTKREGKNSLIPTKQRKKKKPLYFTSIFSFYYLLLFWAFAFQIHIQVYYLSFFPGNCITKEFPKTTNSLHKIYIWAYLNSSALEI